MLVKDSEIPFPYFYYMTAVLCNHYFFKEKAASIKIPTFDESEIVKIYESKVGSSPNLASQF